MGTLIRKKGHWPTYLLYTDDCAACEDVNFILLLQKKVFSLRSPIKTYLGILCGKIEYWRLNYFLQDFNVIQVSNDLSFKVTSVQMGLGL